MLASDCASLSCTGLPVGAARLLTVLADDPPYMTPRLERWRRYTDGPLLIVAVASLPILLLELERSELPSVDRVLIDVVNVVVLVAFAIDYASAGDVWPSRLISSLVLAPAEA